MKGLRVYLIASAIALILYLTAQYFQPKPTDWTPTYLKEDKIPFGLYILNQEIGQLFPNTQLSISRLPAYNTLKDKNLTHTNYLFIAGSVKFDQTDYPQLVKFMTRGNNVFIAAFDISNFLSDTLKLQTSNISDLAVGKNIPVNFVNPHLKGNYLFTKGISDQYFSQVDSSRAVVLGKNSMGRANFVKYPFGKGALYILPNPLLLTNYSLLNKTGAAYAANALSFMPPAENLIWDEYNTKGNIQHRRSILQVLFDHEQLLHAYELAIFGILIFVFFEMKRRQRIIPVIDPLQNSSADFVKVVGKVYYQQRDNSDIAKKKISYLLEHIRTAYRLKTTAINEELVTSVVSRSGINEDTIRQLFTMINETAHTDKVSDQQLIRLNQLIEKFQQQAQ